MKKHVWVSLLLVPVIILAAVTGCAKKEPTATPTPEPVPTTAPSEVPTEAPTAAPTAAPTEDPEKRVIRTLELYCMDQATDPREYEMARFTADSLKDLGLEIDIKAMPWEQEGDIIWYQRDVWDFVMWQMVGRPERSDPDELIYNLFHTSTAETGYNFVGYLNPDYDEIVEAQRSEIDAEKRRDLVWEAQDVLANDQPYTWYVHEFMDFVYNNEVWEPDSIIDQAGIGIKNTWTFMSATPKGEQKDMVLCSGPVIQAINPLYISGGTDSWVTELIWERLMRVGPDGLPQPAAAEKVEWVDGTTVDITIRQGMKWHDGKPVTVEDVVFSFEAPMGEEAPMYKPFVSRIESVEATGDYAVRFKLKDAYVPFETASLAKINLIPKHIWAPILEDMADKPENAEFYQEDVPIGSGPFKFVAWKPSEEVILEANPDHFAPPKMNRWVLRFVANPEAVLGMMHSGELNFISFYGGDPELLVQEVEKDEKLTLVSTIELGSRFLSYNLRRPPFDDLAFRQACALAIDVDAIVNGIYKRRAVPSDNIVSITFDYWHNPNLPQWEFDLDGAKQLLQENGYEWDSQGRLMYPSGKVETLAE